MERGGPPTKASSPEATCAYVSVSLDGFSNNSDFFFFLFLSSCLLQAMGISLSRGGSLSLFFFGLWCLWRNRTFVFCLLSFPFWWNLLAGIKKREKIPKHKRRNNKIIIWKKKNEILPPLIPQKKKKRKSFLLVRTYVFPCYNRLSGSVRSGLSYVYTLQWIRKRERKKRGTTNVGGGSSSFLSFTFSEKK